MNLLRFWKKEPEAKTEESPKEMTPQRLVEYREELLDVGVVTLLVIFSDGREIHTKVYGSFYQHVDDGYRDWSDLVGNPSVGQPQIHHARDVAKNLIISTSPCEHARFIDDVKNPTASWSGVAQHIEIVAEEPYHEAYRIAYIVEKP